MSDVFAASFLDQTYSDPTLLNTNTITTGNADTYNSLCAQIFPNQDVTRLGELAALNPGMNVFSNPQPKTTLTIPNVSQLLKFSSPVFTQIQTTINQGTALLQNLSNIPGVGGYAKQAITDLQKAGHIIQSPSAVVASGSAQYGNALVKIIPWLLSGKV